MTGTDTSAPELLTEEMAASLLSFSPRTLRTWRQVGGGPAFVMVGRSVRYSRADLLMWAATQRRYSSTSEAHAEVASA